MVEVDQEAMHVLDLLRHPHFCARGGRTALLLLLLLHCLLLLLLRYLLLLLLLRYLLRCLLLLRGLYVRSGRFRKSCAIVLH